MMVAGFNIPGGHHIPEGLSASPGCPPEAMEAGRTLLGVVPEGAARLFAVFNNTGQNARGLIVFALDMRSPNHDQILEVLGHLLEAAKGDRGMEVRTGHEPPAAPAPPAEPGGN